MEKNYYVILGVSSNATVEEVKAAFRRRALELHPDRSGKESVLSLKCRSLRRS
jgi:curved DNA-binding protein CbpA